ncbi:type VI secretion system membrane subunit TssM [Pseudomonas sp. FW306-02-F02-AA]|uniref:Type VI secretion protein VasK n=1 Tax=Pseudomonas fluorescens TaxID=294 RepID=A0A0N9VSQ5_PSEFL|nr:MULTISPECIES: type VI secretion system membrane subunit TssM [Pseudomonas]ALI01269.1 type VI secretion protein VasK [Pseudomonas fluorescens]PMZ01895.1 type VI secretion system membrane subunit TssM [Pseudomonas sp. FW306-02-F02-AB]PMZ07697.1 type VI secretion system membrane subunit TssM [Pseudomonas sp. FW306-02-H06C]PMZ13544.1 type VI secretion system membrane subunit TssM [Pseudomonas sp. FW306-02-F02-AA]PMZ19657.1 type VI secretion system membrane subunit TssM [Pseudomonas sp. FW306-02
MKKLFKKVGAFLRKTWVWTLLLVLFVALLVWFVGPLLAVNDYKFWEGSTSRLLTISVLFLIWGLTMVFVSWRAGVRKKAVEETEDGQERIHREGLIDEEQKELRARFKDALRTLKTSSLYRGRSERWRNDLPWYLLIGPQGSGKTSLLDFSGLEFPINKIDRKLTRDTIGTRHCDWYFADHGVLIDTAGRYLTQPDVGVDGSAWTTLLDLLRKRRRNRPLNGVLVTIPVELLLSGTEQDLDTLARQVRARLQDVHQKLHVDLPIYLVLSKADQLLGFDEFFDQLTREESDQVLGTSFRKEQSGTDVAVLRAEFEELLRRLNSQVIMRMHQERDTQRRGRILDFPHQLGQIGEHLCLFVDMAFTGNRYQRVSQLRGFYLTSAPHLKQQMDQSTAGIGANLGIDSGVLPTLRSGRSRFIHHVLSRVIFPEADLAGLDKRERSRIHWGQRALYVGALAALGLFGLLWATGFSANYERLEHLRSLAQTWTQQRSALTARDDAMGVLKTLDTRYEATKVFPPKGDVSMFERGGLYQGQESNPVVKDAYRRELETQLLPRVAQLLEGQIRNNMKDRGRLLNSLRAYLMLNMKDRRDPAWLKDWVAQDWSVRYTGNTAVQNGLNGHFEHLLEQPFIYPLNDALVAQARQVLRSESLATVVYRMLREQARNLPDYRFSQHLGPQGALFVGTDYVIPGFYTQQGYQQYFSVQGSALVTDILRDNWVLGEGSGMSGMDLRRLMVKLEQLYFRDYANFWSEAVGQVALRPINDAGEGAEQLAGLTSANSPVLQMLVEVRENTRFPATVDNTEDVTDAAEKLLAKKGGALGKVAAAVAGKAGDALATKTLPDTAKKSLQRRFEPLHRLLDDNNGPAADLTPALQALNDLQLQLSSLARASAPDQAAFEMAKTRMSGQRDALSNLRNASGRLPRPISVWFNVLAEDTWRLVLNDSYQYLNQRYQSELYSFYGKAINKRYPFNAHSTSDVAISDFREFFKTQGIADRFFDTYMRPFVSGDPGNYRLRSIDGHSLPMSKVYLDQMAAAQVIRQSFFAENPAEPQVQFKLEPYTLDPTVSRSEFRFGDKTMEYRHGPIVPVAFKWPTDAQDGRTSLVLEKMAGRPIGIEKNTGPWSLFRLFDLMQTEYLSGRDVLVLKADVGGLRANYLLMSQRAPNPFDMGVLRTFRMPVQL